MAEQTPQLDPSELYNKRKSKDASRLRAYNKILEQIYNRIRVLSKLPNSPCYLLYTVPPFILGLPKIDLEDCVIYLIYQLRHSKYEVRYTAPNMLYISWIHHEQSYIVQQSPIMAAMLESAERSQAETERAEKEASRLLYGKKSQRKVQIQVPGSHHGSQNGPPNTFAQQTHNMPQRTYTIQPPSKSAIHSVLNRPLSNPLTNKPTAGPPPPSAADYVPPNTFLQSISNPQNTVVQPKSSIDYFK